MTASVSDVTLGVEEEYQIVHLCWLVRSSARSEAPRPPTEAA